MKKRITSLVISSVLICITIIGLQNSKVVEAADDLVLLEKRHSGYWNWLRTNATSADSDQDNIEDVIIYPVSKMYKDEITDKDYQIFLRETNRNNNRAFISFLDGTGFDVENSLYGAIDTSSWTISEGKEIGFESVNYEKKPIDEITDVYEYLTALKNYSFIISARDDAYTGWNDKLQSLLEMNGLKGGFEYRDSYLAVVEDGKVIIEQVSHDPLEYSEGNLYVKSAGYDTGNADSIISISGIDYSVKSRGLNIVVLQDGAVIDSVAFDTWSRLLPAARLGQ